MAHDVFISYAKEDLSTAEAVCKALEDNGIRCWYAPRDVLPSAVFVGAIVKAISESQLMLLILSAHANSSRFVSRECAYADEVGKPLLPFRVEDVQPSEDLKLYLSSVHWLNALTPPLESHLERLVKSVQVRLQEAERQRLAQEEAHDDAAVIRKKLEEEKQRREEVERQRALKEEAARREAEARQQAEEERKRLERMAAARRAAEERKRQEEERGLSDEEREEVTAPLSLSRLKGATPTADSSQELSVKQENPQPRVATTLAALRRGLLSFASDKWIVVAAAVAIVVIIVVVISLRSSQTKLGDDGTQTPAPTVSLPQTPDVASPTTSLGDTRLEPEIESEAGLQSGGDGQKPEDSQQTDNGTKANGEGTKLFNSHRFQEAAEKYREALSLAPNNSHYHYNLGLALYMQGSTSDNKEEQIKYAEEAEKHYNEAVGRVPDNPRYHFGLGNARFMQGMGRSYTEAKGYYEKAAEQYRIAVEHAKANPKFYGGPFKQSQNLASYYENWGDALRGLGNYKDAVKIYSEAIKLDRNNYTYRNDLGTALYNLGDFEGAKRAFEKALELLELKKKRRAPDEEMLKQEALYNYYLGNVLSKQALYTEALAKYKRAVEIRPKNNKYQAGLKDVKERLRK